MGERFTVDEAIAVYLDHLKTSGARESTIKTYTRHLQLAREHFGGDRDLSKALPAHTARWFTSDAVLKDPKSGNPRAEQTVRQIRRVWRNVLAHCHGAGLIENLPLPKGEGEKGQGRKEEA